MSAALIERTRGLRHLRRYKALLAKVISEHQLTWLQTKIYLPVGGASLSVDLLATPEERINLFRQHTPTRYGPLPDIMGFHTIFAPRYTEADATPPPGKSSIDPKVIELAGLPPPFRSFYD